MENEKLKDVPITLPDETQVVKGMKIFSVEKLSPTSYDQRGGNYYRTHTGSVSSKIVEHTVVAVNQAANSRSFTIRSDRGCEHTYTVKNSCLPHLYGKKANAIAKQKEFITEDIEALKKKTITALRKLKYD